MGGFEVFPTTVAHTCSEALDYFVEIYEHLRREDVSMHCMRFSRMAIGGANAASREETSQGALIKNAAVVKSPQETKSWLESDSHWNAE